MTAMRIVDLCTCRHTNQPKVLLEDGGRRRWLSFYLPLNEANRLARVLGKTPCDAVPVFELIDRVIAAGQLEMDHVEIHGDDGGVCASIVLRRGPLEVTVPCHPADALALAVRAEARILASDAALAHACAADPQLRALTMQRWLDGVTRADFDDRPAS